MERMVERLGADQMRLERIHHIRPPPVHQLLGQIADERKKGSFETVESFKQRTGVTKTVTEALMSEGVFKDIPESSQLSFF